MISKIDRRSFQVMSAIILTFLMLACTKKPAGNIDQANVASCEGCHTNYTYLKEVYTPDTAAAVGGCGGEAPHYEPYDRVYLDPEEGYTEYKASEHYEIGCTGCHNGNNNTDDKNIAHSGDFLKHPSMEYEDKCGSCHSTITDGFMTSIHQGTGQKRKVTMRSGLDGAEDFDKLPQHQIEGYTANCATCHGTCGNCHVVRPPIGGGGLISGHNFNLVPDMKKVCITCHVSRGGHAYLGVAPGTVPDVHYVNPDPEKEDMRYTCLDCHNGAELHGDGQAVEQRYAYSKLPKCENCHSEELADSDNIYHTKHMDDFNCQVCHSQVYNNCGSCHIHGEGARIPSYMDFKIAKNPIPDVKSGFEFALVRRTLAAPDNWQEYVDEDYADFEAFPTYNYTTPHNIQKWTARTNESGAGLCGKNCHFKIDGNDTINKNLYLLKENLLDWEMEATSGITMDDELFNK